MEQLNVTQADLMAKEDAEHRAKRAGLSDVTVAPNPEHPGSAKRKAIRLELWHTLAADAIRKFFDVRYSTARRNKVRPTDVPRIVFTFRGIAENTVAAAYAFEMVFYTILTFCMERKDVKGSRNSYRRGVAQGLLEQARLERKEEEQRAAEAERKALAERIAKEEEERRKELERLRGPDSGVAMEEVEEPAIKREEPRASARRTFADTDDQDPDSEDDGGQDVGVDFEDDPEPATANGAANAAALAAELDRLVAAQDAPPLAAPPAAAETQPDILADAEPLEWKSVGQLVRFRKDAMKIAEEALKIRGTRLKKRRVLSGGKLDKDAFQRGKQDSKKIDVKRRKIEGPSA
ncbi:hypothetical protein DFJ74DRAFT_695848 [Hyaloraphidium curvatum]|nr:hypothetical protein DFJ74DRAFT_695848 [Hyaloraphidium curvatum]